MNKTVEIRWSAFIGNGFILNAINILKRRCRMIVGEQYRCYYGLLVLFSFLTTVPWSTWAQSKSCMVVGVVVDSLSNSPIPYATVEYRLQADAQHPGGALTLDDGAFVLQVPSEGLCQFTIRSLGYKALTWEQAIKNPQTQLDTIRLTPEEALLDEVMVVARRKLIQLSPVGLTYDMKNDALAQTDNLLFALRNVPLVSVDGEETIRIKGSTNFSVYINGTPSRVASMSPTEVLRGIPANTIKRVEVITRLDARYDASAGDAILNIITDRKTLDGYSGSLSLKGSTIPTIDGATTLTLTKGKLSVALAYDYSYTLHQNQPLEISRRTFAGAQTTSELKSIQGNGNDNKGVFQHHIGRIMGEYALDSLNILYADGHFTAFSVNTQGIDRQIFSRLGMSTHYAILDKRMSRLEGSAEGNLIYRKLYAEDKTPQFSVGYRYAYNPDQRYNDITERQYRDGFTSWEASLFDEVRRKECSRGGLSEHALQSDYQFRWRGGHSMHIGAKEVVRLGSSRPEYHVWDYGKSEWRLVDNPLYQLGDMSQLQSVTSAYANYSWNKDRFGLSLGLRGEFVYDKISFTRDEKRNFQTQGLGLIPTLDFSYNLTDRQQLSFFYKMNPIRPSIWRLNPYRSLGSPYDLSFGNPNLKSERLHSLDLSYTLFSNNCYLSLSAGYSHTDNAIMPVSYRDAENPNILCNTYANAGTHRKPSVSFWTNWRPIMPLSLTFHGIFQYHLFDHASQGIQQRSWENLLMVNTDVSLPKAWFLGTSWYCFSNPPQLRTTYSYSHQYSLYVKKDFFDNKFNVTLMVNHPFSQYKRFETKRWGDDFEYRQVNYIQSRSIGLKISYNFNSGKSRKVTRNQTLSTTDLDTQTGVR